jgi:hypothetical protein
MAIESYIKQVDDHFNQGYLIDLLGDREIAGGICRMLSVQWVIECLKPHAPAPDVCLREMKSHGPVYFKQIGQSQKAYAKDFSDAELGNFGSMHEVLSLASAGTRSIIAATQSSESAVSAATMSDALTYATGVSTTTPRGCLISLKMRNAGHCIAAFEEPAVNGSKWYLFDPNFGVMTVDVSAGEDFSALLTDVWNAYAGMVIARAFPVQ